jgi:hypothetical protein
VPVLQLMVAGIVVVQFLLLIWVVVLLLALNNKLG